MRHTLRRPSAPSDDASTLVGSNGHIDAEKAQNIHHDNAAANLSQLENPPTKESNSLHLDEDALLAYARAHPNTTKTLYLIFHPLNDPSNPRHWPLLRRWWITSLACFANILTCVAAGGISSGSSAIASQFHVSGEVTTLALSLYILGFAFGPLLLAPLSEYYGRSPVYLVGWGLLVIFNIPIALAPNIGTILVCRFIQGFAGSAPLSNTGGTVSDLWARDESGAAMAFYGVSSTSGPPLALVVSGYIAMNLGWHWIFWFDMIVLGTFWIILIVTLRETRHSIILDKKATRIQKVLRAEGNPAAEHVLDVNADSKKGLHNLFAVTLTRPFHFLFTEPITYFSAIFNGFIYGIVYLFNEAFPLVFGPGGHGFNTGEWGLSFLGLFIGPLIGAALHPLQERYYLRKVRENGGKGVPEARMWMARVGAITLPISLFWFAWTSYSTVFWIVPILASALFGWSIYVIILGILSYVIDSYQAYSASALAGVILVRNVVGGGFPLFAAQMYKRLGYEWASSLLAFLGILLIPIPFLFFHKGEAIRLKSPWAREHFDQEGDGTH